MMMMMMIQAKFLPGGCAIYASTVQCTFRILSGKSLIMSYPPEIQTALDRLIRQVFFAGKVWKEYSKL